MYWDLPALRKYEYSALKSRGSPQQKIHFFVDTAPLPRFLSSTRKIEDMKGPHQHVLKWNFCNLTETTILVFETLDNGIFFQNIGLEMFSKHAVFESFK